ncbi:MAG TPA: hypothetical protein VEK57_29860 [Thermoanaerobaculia bacterium]|nr:hypothetical protein [Thermoanaerobaculia bacterium]
MKLFDVAGGVLEVRDGSRRPGTRRMVMARSAIRVGVDRAVMAGCAIQVASSRASLPVASTRMAVRPT